MKADSTKKVVAFKPGMSQQEAREMATSNQQLSNNLLWECAMKLRSDILELDSNPLEERLTVDSIMRGEVDIPESVSKFFTTLYVGNTRTEVSKRKKRLVDSTSAYVVYSFQWQASMWKICFFSCSIK